MIRPPHGRGEGEPQPTDTIELSSGELKLVVDPTDGARVTELALGNTNIFSPYRHIHLASTDSTKPRGGMHICLPHFDDEAEFGMSKHGFGRDVPWQVAQRSNNSLTLSMGDYTDQPGVYPSGLAAQLTYTVREHTDMHIFSTVLTVTNTRNDHQALPVAPGFHPYFAVADNKVAICDHMKGKEGGGLHNGGGVLVAWLESMNPALHFVGGATDEVVVNAGTGYDYTFVLDGRLNSTTLWTDNLDREQPYACIEPTTHGPHFDDEDSRINLQPGTSENFDFHIAITPTGDETMQQWIERMQAERAYRT